MTRHLQSAGPYHVFLLSLVEQPYLSLVIPRGMVSGEDTIAKDVVEAATEADTRMACKQSDREG